MEKDPNTYTGIFELWKNGWVFFIATIGGIVHHIQRIRKGELDKFDPVELFFDVITSGFIGFMAFYTASHFQLSTEIIGVTVGMASYSGTVTLKLLKDIISKESIVKLNIDIEDNKKNDS